MRVLNLVTNDRARFYRQQVDVLEARGVDCVTLPVPGYHHVNDESASSRSLADYVRFVPTVLRRSFGEYDLVHANYGLTAPAALAQPNLPVVVSLWGSDLMGRLGAVSKLCARRADATIVMSEEMAAELGGDCTVIPHGIDLDRFRPVDRREAREELGWAADRRHVLFPYPKGRGVKDYPRAARLVDRARERLGSPVELQTVHGVPHERMNLYMNAADVLLLTSKREGSPNSVKEAMACGLPVVSTDVGDVRRRLDGVSPATISDDDAALIDGLVEALEAGGRSNGREVVREIGLERMGERIHGIYESVLDGRDGASAGRNRRWVASRGD